jgi:hypothetical protein
VTLGPNCLAADSTSSGSGTPVAAGDNVGMIREARSLTRSVTIRMVERTPSHTKLMAKAILGKCQLSYDETFHLVFTPEESRKNVLNGRFGNGLFGFVM